MSFQNSTAVGQTRPAVSRSSTLIVARMAFGATVADLRPRHIPIFSDLDAGFDLTEDLTAPLAVAAAVATEPPGFVRLNLEGDRNTTGFLAIRARVAGTIVVKLTTLEMFGGWSSVDLPIEPHLPIAVGTFDRDWFWEIATDTGEFEPLIAPTGDSVWPTRTYLTAGFPAGNKLVESFFHIACAIESPPTPEAAESVVWQTFSSGRPIVNVRGRSLSFWKNQIPGVGNEEYISRMAIDLICIGDASCRAWAELLHLCLAVHGIASDVKAVRPKLSVVLPRLGLPSFITPNGHGGREVQRTIGLMVKGFQWNTQPAPVGPENDRQTINAFKFQWRLDNPADTSARDWEKPEVIDIGRKSHGNEKAPGLFGNHAIVRTVRDGIPRWYDPSFGLGPHATITDYEDDLLGRGSENPGGVFAIVGWQKSPDGQSNQGLLLAAHPLLPVPVLETVDVA